ncbi:putative membrane protein [Methanolobus bombayensis]|nr:putative membrane protein [Methanolobus bombayensis]
MNKKRILLLMSLTVFVILSFSASAQEATIHGAVYEWDSFAPLENVIVEVNSTPSQSMLATYGLYSFNLDPGNYMISASYYSNNELVAYTEEQITISDDGDYVLDLILFPVYSDPLLNESDFSELEDIADLAESGDQGSSSFLSESTSVILIILLILLLFGVAVFVNQKKDSHMPGGTLSEGLSDDFVSDDSLGGLPDDLREVVSIIAENDGRITQKDLRTKVKHSEAKVSLMISDLESRGIVRKFKKGRGNVIILEDKNEEDNFICESALDNSSPDDPESHDNK